MTNNSDNNKPKDFRTIANKIFDAITESPLKENQAQAEDQVIEAIELYAEGKIISHKQTTIPQGWKAVIIFADKSSLKIEMNTQEGVVDFYHGIHIGDIMVHDESKTRH